MVRSSWKRLIFNSFVERILGPPGVGKTSTAETLAESCRKILLPVGIGDLGTEAETVEVSLRRLFRLVIAWDGILLM